MDGKKTLPDRERELQALLATAAGREELNQLASRYHAAGSNLKPTRMSIVTYILVHERQHGLISG